MTRSFTACIVAFLLLAGNLWADDTSYLEICKAQCVGHMPLSGNFKFIGVAWEATVPVGACSGPIGFNYAGSAFIVEGKVLGVGVSKIEAYGYDHVHNSMNRNLPPDPVNRLVSSDYVHRQAEVTLVAGGIENETVAVFTNCKYGTGLLKICKVAGPGVSVNDAFNFTVSGPDGDVRYIVPAGPPPNGYCQLAGAYPVGTQVRVEEFPPDGILVSNIAVSPPERGEHKVRIKSTLTSSTALPRRLSPTPRHRRALGSR